MRVLMQHYILSDMTILDTMSIRQIVDADISVTTLPASILLDRRNDDVEVTTDPRHIMATKMEAFRARVAIPYINLLRTMCQNRCRYRRVLMHSIMEWDIIQLDAEDLDQELVQFTNEEAIVDGKVSDQPIWAFPLSSWAYHHKLRQMETLVQLGFELQVYQPDELAGMYWYLHYLAKTRSGHLERIRSFIVRDFKALSRHGAPSDAQKDDILEALSFNSLQVMETAATYVFADALSSLYTVLYRLKLLAKPTRPYSSDALRYEVRMRPFSSIGLPQLLPFDQFEVEVQQPRITSLELLVYAMTASGSAKRSLEALSKLDDKAAFCQGSHKIWVQDVKNRLKACISASICIAAVKKALDSAGDDQQVDLKVVVPRPGEGYHDWWIIPKVVPNL